MGNASSKSPVSSSGESPRSETSQLLSILLSLSRYSDRTVICNGQRFPVHSAVICTQSKPLAAAINGGFQESITGEIDLSDHDPHAVECMLNFLYMSQYDDGQNSLNPQEEAPKPEEESWKLSSQLPSTSKTNSGDEEDNTNILNQDISTTTQKTTSKPPPILLNTHVYVLAEKYDIPALKSLSSTKYKELTTSSSASPDFLSDLITSFQIILEETPSSDTLLRNPAFSALENHAQRLVDLEDFKELCMFYPEITLHLVAFAKATLEQADKNEHVKMCYACRTCYDWDTVECGCSESTTFRCGEVNYGGSGLCCYEIHKGSRKTKLERDREMRAAKPAPDLEATRFNS